MWNLEEHCQLLWTKRLTRPGRGWRDYFLLDYFPLVGPGMAPLCPDGAVSATRAHRVRYLNNFSRRWSIGRGVVDGTW